MASVRDRLTRASASCSARSSSTLSRRRFPRLLDVKFELPVMMPLAPSSDETSDCCSGQAKLADELKDGLMLRMRISNHQRHCKPAGRTLSFSVKT